MTLLRLLGIGVLALSSSFSLHAAATESPHSTQVRPALIQRFNHLTLPVSDMTRARWFYGEVLGLVEVPRTDDPAAQGAWYTLGSSLLHVVLKPHSEQPGSFTLWSNNVYRTAQVLEDAGLPVEWDDLSSPGIEGFSTRDPSGNVIEIEGFNHG